MLSSQNDAFYEKAERSLRALFDTARAKHELHFAMALAPEMRGARDDATGWNTAADAYRAFDEYLEFLAKLDDGPMRRRIILAFYCHIAEASGFYEVPKNMLRIAGGQSHAIWPFQHPPEIRKNTENRIAPNANKVMKDLIGHAAKLEFNELAEVFRDAFDADIRNGYAHADYVVWNDGLRLPKRNGGDPKCIPWIEFYATVERGVNFFDKLRKLLRECQYFYDPPKTIKARLASEPEGNWTISCDPKTRAFRITNGTVPVGKDLDYIFGSRLR
jgi:hypothetical protein